MEDYQELRKKVRNLISQNKTGEAVRLLAQESFSTIDKKLILLNGRLKKLKDDEDFGIIDDDEARQEINKINLTILDLVEQIGMEPKDLKEIITSSVKGDTSSNTQSKKQTFNKKWLFLLVIPLAVFLIYWTMSGKDSQSVDTDSNKNNKNITNAIPENKDPNSVVGSQYLTYDIKADKSAGDIGNTNSDWKGVSFNEINAVVNWGNGHAYFFSGDQYLRYAIKANMADEGYPKKMEEKRWPGLTFTNIDAAVNWGNGKAYFFSGDQYARYDIAEDLTDVGYPSKITERSWPGLTFSNIDAAVNWGNGKVYFFSGDYFARYDIEADKTDDGYPKMIDKQSWPGLTFKKIDAVANWGNDKAYLFRNK